MNRARVICAFAGLALGLLFYLAHRSDHTLSNRVVSSLCGHATYSQVKYEVKRWLPVPLLVRGCLPSALWCFIASSLLGGWKVRMGSRRVVALASVCPLANASWELVQWSGWTDGRGDWCDVAAGFAGWGVSQLVFLGASRPVELVALWGWRLGVVISGFACMGLADVWK